MIKKIASVLLISMAVMVISTGCMPPPKIDIYEEIAPNETAFIVPLEGANDDSQGKFMSVEFLENARVATKRISIPQKERKIGRWWWNIEWIPTVKVIKVDRSPVTREWTADPSTGTSEKNQALVVESKDSITFWTGITVTARITEEDASTFLYNFSGKPLSEVVDENVRGFVLAVLSREFGRRVLDKCRTEKSEIFELALNETQAEFAEKGGNN